MDQTDLLAGSDKLENKQGIGGCALYVMPAEPLDTNPPWSTTLTPPSRPGVASIVGGGFFFGWPQFELDFEACMVELNGWGRPPFINCGVWSDFIQCFSPDPGSIMDHTPFN